MMAAHAWQSGSRRRQSLELLARQQHEHVRVDLAAVPRPGEERAPGADDERAAVPGDQLLSLKEISRRKLPAVVPRHRHRGSAAAGGKLHLDDAPERRCLSGRRVGQTWRAVLHDHRRRRAEIETPIRRVEVVDAHVADGACAEVPEASPFEWHISRVVGTLWRRTQPHVPVETLGHFGRVGRPHDALDPPPRRPVGPHVQLRDLADETSAQDFHGAARALVGVALRPHLRHHAVF